MKYLCLVILDGDIAAEMKPEDWTVIDEDSMAYDRELMRRGCFIAAQALHGPESARTIRIRRGETIATDGPFMETKEQVAGFILVDVPDMEAALEVARGIPLARIGAVEVRPVMEFEQR